MISVAPTPIALHLPVPPDPVTLPWLATRVRVAGATDQPNLVGTVTGVRGAPGRREYRVTPDLGPSAWHPESHLRAAG